MNVRALFVVVSIAAVSTAPAFAQSPRPRTPSGAQQPGPPAPAAPPAPATAPAPPAAPAPRREGQPINVKVELTILDQRGAGAASRKTVSVVVADGMTGFIRSSSNYTMGGRVESVPLNVDVDPQILADGKIRLRIGVWYDLPNSLAVSADGPDKTQGNLFSTQLRESLAIIVENGKPLVAAQSAEPVGDRQVTIEVKATVLR